MPGRIRGLPLDHRGYPVPRFVEWIDGVPDFRIIDSHHLAECVRRNRCWICGEKLGNFKAFVIGPMCAVNRISAEPPSHLDCATFAACACPFLTRPKAERREAGMPEETKPLPGLAIRRNPGVALVWVCLAYRIRREGDGVLFKVGEPTRTLWYCQGRIATRAEVLESIDSGLPILRQMAEQDGAEAVAMLDRMHADALQYVPA